MSAEIYRVPTSRVVIGGRGSIICDRGALQHAVLSSNGHYLFSEVGAGTRPLAIIGKWNEVTAFIGGRPDTKIINTISKLPELFGRVGWYTPANRFEGLFPVQDSIQHLADHFSNLGSPTPPSIAGSKGPNYKRQKVNLDSTDIVVYISYLQESDMGKIGTGSIKFSALLPIVLKGLRGPNMDMLQGGKIRTEA